jgi:hypothetical protein
VQRVLAAMQRLTSAAGVTEGGRLARALDPEVELEEFDRRLRELREQQAYDESARPTAIDIEALWQRWTVVRPDLSSFSLREVRALCWDARAAADRQFVESLVTAGYIPSRLPMLRGLWHVHQAAWRLSTAPLIEVHVKAAAARSGYRPRWLESIRQHPGVLSGRAPAVLEQVQGDDWEIQPVLQRFGVTPDGQLGEQVIDKVIERWLREVIRRSMIDDTCVIVHEGHVKLLSATVLALGRFRRVVERLLLQVPKGSSQYRAAVASLILSDERLGHPKRVMTRGNWIGLADEAIRIAVQLFAARDLGVFFEILIERGADEQRRRSFWERYVASPQLVNFAIACDWQDARRLKARSHGERTTAAHLADAPENHSAFIMRFRGRKDITVVEMSQANNALYVFDSDDFEHHVGSLEDRSFSFPALKDRELMIDRWTHRWPWHERFGDSLATFGIHPGRAA